MAKKIAIIGAGIAGLSAGCYARMNGYEVDIYEAHSLPGGMCTAWKRKGYTIDGCIHWLVGSDPDAAFHRIWEELGASQGRKIHNHDRFATFVGKDGKKLVLYTDIDKLEKHLVELSPQDAEVSKDLCKTIRKMARSNLLPKKTPELLNVFDKIYFLIKFAPYIGTFMKIGDRKMEDLADRYKDPFLRKAFRRIFVYESVPLLGMVMTMAPMSKHDAGFPLGGSLEFSKAIERRFLSLGGRIHYKSKVERILEEDGRAIGIRLKDGSEVMADHIISASDLKNTLYHLLDGRRMQPAHRELLEKGKLYPSGILVTFGVDMDLSGGPSSVGTIYELDRPVTMGHETHDTLHIKNYCYDPSLTPKGKSIIMAFIMSDNWEYWENLRKDNTAYKAEKERIVGVCREEIEKRYPGFSSKIEMTDVATPNTFERYTGDWKGTFMTWILTNDFNKRYPYIPKTVPGLRNFYTASMWTNPPGGLPGAAMAGWGVVQLICKKDGKKFKTSKP